jgi:pimeloyl-ACP methyl ester carboxylesterase
MIRLVEYGTAGDRPPLLAIPGMDGSVGTIAPIVDLLARQRRVVLADYAAETNSTLEALTEEIAGAVATQLTGPLDLLGHSIGSIVAAQAADRPDLRVRSVVLIGTFTRLRWRVLGLSRLSATLLPRWFYQLTSAPVMAFVCGPVGDGWRHPFFAAVRASNPAGIAKRIGWEIGRDFSVDLLRVRQPTLVLMGDRDRFVPNIGEELAKLRRLFADRPATVITIPGAGHVLLPSASITTAVAEIERFLAA